MLTGYNSIVLFSGGLDSTVCLEREAKNGDGRVVALHYSYGQPHDIETAYATDYARGRQGSGNYEFMIIVEDLPVPQTGLIDCDVFGPHDSPVVHGRNLMFLSYALAFACKFKIPRVVIGCTLEDRELFADCRPEFFREFNSTSMLLDGPKVEAPLIDMTKRQVVQLAQELGIDIDRTWSCYAPQGDKPCQSCLACNIRDAALLSLDGG